MKARAQTQMHRVFCVGLLTVCLLGSLCLMSACGGGGRGDSFTLPERSPVADGVGVERFGNWSYQNYDDGTVGILSYDGFEQRVIMPDRLDGKAVTVIEAGAFAENETVKEVRLGKYVEMIGDEAFYGCPGLTEVILPDAVWSVGTAAFDKTPWLESRTEDFVIVGNGILLRYQGKEKQVTVPEAVRHLSSAFGMNHDICSVTLGDNVLTVGRYAFGYCGALREVQLGENLRLIDDNAFDNCTSLTHIHIPDRVEKIGQSAFYYCNYLTDAYVGQSVVSIGDSAFSYCVRLHTLTLPGGLSRVSAHAFEDCMSLVLVLYGGDETDFAALEVGPTNYMLSDAHIIYRYGGEKP